MGTNCRAKWQSQIRELLNNTDLWRRAAQHCSTTARGLEQVVAPPTLLRGQGRQEEGL